jgi:aryl-alcohol dehydrogenase-like predicted oxidoreductase
MSNTDGVVEYRQLGKSGLRVSVPIFGGMSFGTPKWAPWVIGEEQALPVLKAAWDRGINTIDTANVYSNGESEKIISTFIRKYDIPREKLVIMTKIFSIVTPEPHVMAFLFPEYQTMRDHINQFGLSRAAIFNTVDASLARLGTTYIDLLQIHRFDPDTPPEETMKALHDLIAVGKVRYIGASSMRAWQFSLLNHVAQSNGWTTFVSMQPEYSLLYREEEREMLDYCKFHGIGVIPYSPLATGNLTRPAEKAQDSVRVAVTKGTPFETVFKESDKAIIGRVQELAQKHKWTMAQVALVWASSKVTSPIVGLNSVKRLDEAVAIRGKALTPEEIKYLEEPYTPQPVRGM